MNVCLKVIVWRCNRTRDTLRLESLSVYPTFLSFFPSNSNLYSWFYLSAPFMCMMDVCMPTPTYIVSIILCCFCVHLAGAVGRHRVVNAWILNHVSFNLTESPNSWQKKKKKMLMDTTVTVALSFSDRLCSSVIYCACCLETEGFCKHWYSKGCKSENAHACVWAHTSCALLEVRGHW